MAVVLKTSGSVIPRRLYFGGLNRPSPRQNLARIRVIWAVSEPNPITDHLFSPENPPNFDVSHVCATLPVTQESDPGFAANSPLFWAYPQLGRMTGHYAQVIHQDEQDVWLLHPGANVRTPLR